MIKITQANFQMMSSKMIQAYSDKVLRGIQTAFTCHISPDPLQLPRQVLLFISEVQGVNYTSPSQVKNIFNATLNNVLGVKKKFMYIYIYIFEI